MRKPSLQGDIVFYRHFYFPVHLVDDLPSAIFWTKDGHRCRPLSPSVLAFIFVSRKGVDLPTARRFSSTVADSRSRAFRYSMFMRENLLYDFALGET